MPSNTPASRKITPKQRVLKHHPHAFAEWYCDDICRILDRKTRARLGGGTAPKAAWADAARNL